MFNIDTFKAHKQGIRENMESNLIWDKYHGTKKHKSSTYVEYDDVIIKFDDEPEEIALKMQIVTNLYKLGHKVNQEELIEQPYCTRHMVGVRYAYETDILRSHIDDRQVTNAMREFVTNKIRLETNSKYVELECKVMDLFKAGIIDWEMVIESHKRDCSL